ncbi:MAG: pantetheine-phosphate adenylyltransferase [Fibrobacter sp.]|uniref:pantetheine-phosphate adenylyltransferase n=1 Tax=Fibrobacter sp. TaxID=35828 RepID=UPI002A91AC46|nr:pantetheine-phosphate adenylyltransferase [Fibrobacter sp.]MDY6264489.1 pantetheine-phosphate adenylyltransferase [Fibrobacter sp.]
MKKIAVFAGSFDPFTLGHLDIVRRAAALFDELYVLLAVNASKKYMFSESARIEMIRKAVAGVPNVKVESFDGLTVEFMKRIGAKFLVRGIRGSADVEYEQSVAWNNKVLYPECETVFLSSAPEHLMVSSTVVRELLKVGIAGSEEGRTKLAKYVHEDVLPLLITSTIDSSTQSFSTEGRESSAGSRLPSALLRG